MANIPAVPKDLSLRAVKDRLFDWKEIILILLVLVLIYQVIVPFAMIVWASFKTVHPGEPSFINFDFSVANYARAFGSKEFWEATRMTLIYATTCTVFAFLGGLFLAWVVTRTNTPGAQFIGMVTLARIVIPTILITVSWILVASPSIGMANKLIIMAGGPARFFNVYTFWGMVWVQGVEIIPLAYLLIMAALQSMDPRLEEASVMTGASTWRTTMRITVPLVTPAVIAAGLLLFITTVENFEVPLLLGGRADVRVYTTEVFFNTARTPTQAETWSSSLATAASYASKASCGRPRRVRNRSPSSALTAERSVPASSAAKDPRADASASASAAPSVPPFSTLFRNITHSSLNTSRRSPPATG